MTIRTQDQPAMELTVSGSTARGTIIWTTLGNIPVSARVTYASGRTSASLRSSVNVVLPQATRFQMVYAVPEDVSQVAERVPAMELDASVVRGWFAKQMGDRTIRLVEDTSGDPLVLQLSTGRTSSEHLSDRLDFTSDVVAKWFNEGQLAPDTLPIVYLEGRHAEFDYCGWATSYRIAHIVIPMDNCEIYPGSAQWGFPYGSTYILAHEIAHALGAVSDSAPHSDGTSHVDDDPRDILYNGSSDRDWDNLMLDPGNDDYFRTGRSDLINIENSPLLETLN